MICEKCKRESPDDSRFCQYCGSEFLVTEMTDITNSEDLPKKGNQKGRKRLLLPALVLLFIAVGGAAINYTIKVNKYSSATDLLKNNDYDLAYEAYLNLGPFKNSSEMALESLYQKAAAQLEDNNLDDASSTLTLLGDYKDSVELLEDIPYRRATLLLENDAFDEAAEAFAALGAYKDSIDKATEAKYQQACKLLGDGEHDSAYELFVELGNYKDCPEKADRAQVKDKEQDEPNRKNDSLTLEQLATIWNGEYNEPPDITYSKIVWDVDIYRGNVVKYQTARTNGNVITKTYVFLNKTQSKMDLSYKAQDNYGNTVYELYTIYIENGVYYIKETNYSGWKAVLSKSSYKDSKEKSVVDASVGIRDDAGNTELPKGNTQKEKQNSLYEKLSVDCKIKLDT